MSSTGATWANIAKKAGGSNPSSNPVSSASSEQGGKSASSQPDAAQSKVAKVLTRSEKESVTPSRLSQGSIYLDEPPRDQKTARSNDTTSEQQRIAEKEDVISSSHTESAADSPKVADADKKGRSASVQDSVETHDKSKDNEEEWEKVSIPSSAAEKSEKDDSRPKDAPLPAVNFWTQRMQQQAKQKEPTVKPSVVPASSQPPKGRQASAPLEDTKKKQNGRDHNTGDQTSVSKHNASTKSRDSQINSNPPYSAPQQSEKGMSQPLPPVDTESWPTPESAIVDSTRRSSAVEKSEKADGSENKASSRKAWQPLPFVPSVKFETQLPGTARRGGGRTTNGRGRGTPSNGNTDRSVEKSDTGNMAPPPLPKNASEQDRGRKSNAVNASRASSLPTEKQRPGMAEQSTVAAVNSTKPSISEQSSSATTENATGASTPPTQDPSRSSSRHTPAVTTTQRPASTEMDVSIDRSSQSMGEKTKTSSNDPSKQPQDSADKPSNKDWQKERANNSQKSENWRTERRANDRAERGRGSTYRGRGNHPSFSNAAFTSPLPQNAFEGPKSNSQAGSRQPSQAFTSPYGSARGIPRSQSIPMHMLGPGFYQPAPGFPANLPPIQTDLGYPPYGQMPGVQGAMSAMPYGDQLGGFALISMVVTQLEYYFSLDNLCKDMYLRKHMDSQGFVPLRVIGEFRRIKALLGDNSMSYDQLRHVAQQVRNIEFVVGEDGEDRLRNRENWRDFVLPVEDRLPEAQNDGPAIKQSHGRYSTGLIPDFHMSNGLRSAPPNVNGFQDNFPSQHGSQDQPSMHADSQNAEQWPPRVDAARQDEERRTSLTSPLSKIQSPGSDIKAAPGLTNGHRDSVSSSATAKENTFPDEEVSKLKVVVKDPEYQGEATGAGEESLSNRVSGLRGSAGSPEQLERFQSMQFGQNARSNIRFHEQAPYFTQGEAPQQYLQPGYIHEEYLSLKEKALSQRAENHFDGACVPLYPLWAEFLAAPNSFNVGMYEDFKTWALEDLEKGSDNGKAYLVRFYDAVLSGKNPMTERLATDLVNIARKEPAGNRPTWLKLRAAWRNGATNMKTRKRLTDLLTAVEQKDLERGT